MSKKNVIANRKQWANVSKEERSKRMRKLVLLRHSKLSDKERKKIGRNMTQIRLKKLKEDARGHT